MEQNKPALSPITILRLKADLMKLVLEKQAIAPGQPMSAFKIASVTAKIIAKLKELGMDLSKPPEPVDPPEDDGPVTTKSLNKRQKDNNAAIEALRRVKAGDADPKDPAIREALKGYSGSGGGLRTAQGTAGSPHEYYTPAPVARAMWTMLEGLGFTGGKVLDPSAGMGVFARTKPDSVAVEQIELDKVSGEINGLLNDSPTVSTRVVSFEEVAASTDDETYDAVVTNVPFGDKRMRGANWKKDRKYQNANLQQYFILRGLEKVKPAGFAAFIVPTSVVSGKGGKAVGLRTSVSMAAEFVGAYRMPNMVFDEAGADVTTDIIVLRKHSKDNKRKIDELAQQNAGILTQANVIWPDFVDGNYFKLEGKRFQIGETAMGKAQWGEAEKVVFTGDIKSVAALLKPFPKKSRIDWGLLGAVETAPIVYAEGDTLFASGAMLQMKDGKLVPVEGGLSNDDNEAVRLLARFTSPLDAITQGLSFADASRGLSNEETMGRLDMVPRWIIVAHRAADATPEDKSEFFTAILAGMAVQELAEASSKEARNYVTEYPELSTVLARVQGYSKKRAGIGGELVANALQGISKARERGHFTAWWLGDVEKDKAKILTVIESYAKIKLEMEDDTGFVPADKLREAYADFDPLNDDQWCVSPDGQGIMSAEDYYYGNYGDFLKRSESDLAEAEDPAIREKLMRQIAKAQERITLVDPSRMLFSLETAFVSQEDKADFIKQYVSDLIVLETDGKGEKSFKYNGPGTSSRTTASEDLRIKTLRRFAVYMNNKTITTQSDKKEAVDDPKAEQALLNAIKDMVQSASAQFDAWCKSNEAIYGAIQQKLNAPENLRFVETPSFAPLDIQNWNPSRTPHGYQNGAVRRFSRRFSGILGFDVGLGKAQPLDAKIMTPSGWKLMGDMRVGDMVIAVDGKAVPVTGVFPQGEKEIFEVEFSDGSKTRCCDEHLWQTQTESDRKKERYSRSKGAARSIAGTVKPLSEIRASLVYQTQKNHKIPMVAPIEFPAKTLPVAPYLMGVLLGDGSMSQVFTMFTTVDKEIANTVCHLLKDGFGDSVYTAERATVDKAPTYGISRRDPSIRNPVRAELKRMGLAGASSHQKFIPDDYLMGSVAQRIEILRGLMDTDGYVSKDGITVQFCSTSRMLADGVVQLVQSLGGIAWVSSKFPNFHYKGEKKTGREAYTVGIRMPGSINPFMLQRKAALVKPKSKYEPVRYFTAVREVGKAPAQCISIDHPTHLYVTDDYIVTHNTLTALATVQYCHSIGSKKKTVFVVPSSVLTNWKKEAGAAYLDMSDCLFVGLVASKKGKMEYDPASVDADLNRIRANRHAKIFMTYESFARIPLRKETLDAYGDYLLATDDTFAQATEESVLKKTRDVFASENAVAKALEGGKKSAAVPYFEDMGIDSIVIDEAHCFPAGTLVDGRRIEDLRVGDFVRSYNHEAGIIEYKPITDIMSRVPSGLVKVKFKNGTELVATHDHPFYVVGIGYVNAEFLNDSYTVVFNNSKTSSEYSKIKLLPSRFSGQGQGCEEGGFLEVVGVDSVEVLECGRDGRFGGVCPTGLVYDITVDGNHNFFAEGVLVHNCFKNSKLTSSEFKQTKFVSNPKQSNRGMDMQAKCWYIRGITNNNDGVMALTATPLTNSPVEAYSMMSLAIGEKEMNAMCGCTGADSFMMNTCDVENRDEDDITGQPRNARTLKGIANLDILRRLLDSAAVIETTKTVAAKGIIIEVPEAEESMSAIELGPEYTAVLVEIKKSYLTAQALKKSGAKLDQKTAIIASPFNAMRAMTKLITDDELYVGKFSFAFTPKDAEKAAGVVASFNKLKITEERKEYELPDDADTSTFKSKVVNDHEMGEDVLIFYVPVLASIERGSIILPAVNYDTHDRFMKLVDKAGLGVRCKASPKIKAMLANLQKENAHPRWRPAKQIVFCDELALHHKLRIMIAAETGIPANKICIVNAKSVSPDEIQGVQDGFNANEDDNKYSIIIANKKAEVGINLQNGTQAIHHLTIGWTPDSIQQRNGRGVRQGNKVQTPVMIYHYEANGTFDAYKRRLVSVKGDWINSLMDKDADRVTIEGALSAEDEHRMTTMVGDSDGMAKFNEDMAKKAKRQVAESAKIAQVNALSVMTGRKQWLEKFSDPKAGFTNWVVSKRSAAGDVASAISDLRDRMDKSESSGVIKRCEARIAELDAKRDAILATVDGAPTFLSGRQSVNVDTLKQDCAAVVNWRKELAINTKMLDEARAACLSRMTQGYNKQVLEKIDAKEAVVISGKIITDGDLLVANGVPGVVKVTASYHRPTEVKFISADSEGDLGVEDLAGMAIQSHGTPGSEDRADILKILVELDEAQILKGNQTYLFAQHSMDVRNALRSVIPSLWITDGGPFGNEDGWVAAPNFPIILPGSADYGSFLMSIAEQQRALIEVKESDYSYQKPFRFKDWRKQGAADGRNAWTAVADWMTANNKIMTLNEAASLDRIGFTRQAERVLAEALNAAVAKSKNITEFNASFVAMAQASYPWIDGITLDTLKDEFGFEYAIQKAQTKLDDGSAPYRTTVAYSDIESTGVAVAGLMQDAILAEFEAGALNAELIAFIEKNQYAKVTSPGLRRIDPELANLFDLAVINAIGGKPDGENIDMASSPFAEAIRAGLKLGKGAVITLVPNGRLMSPANLQRTVQAYYAKKASEAASFDLDGLVAAIAADRDILSAKVGMTSEAKVRDTYSGSFMYEAGKYIRVEIKFGSKLQKRMSDREEGLNGRYFNKNAKDWLFNIAPATFSDGKPVADIGALAKFIGIDVSQFKKA